MRKTLLAVAGAFLAVGAVSAGPEDDRVAFQDYFTKRFPHVEKEAFVNGVYALDTASYEQWLQIEEFPPYELALSEGETLFNTPFANGKTYADCFPNGGIGVRQWQIDTLQGLGKAFGAGVRPRRRVDHHAAHPGDTQRRCAVERIGQRVDVVGVVVEVEAGAGGGVPLLRRPHRGRDRGGQCAGP